MKVSVFKSSVNSDQVSMSEKIFGYFIGFQWSGALKNGSMTYYCKWVMDNNLLGSQDACYLILAMLSDVIDHIERRHAIRAEGLVMSIYSSIMCGGSAICNALFSRVLSVVGYDQNADLPLGILAQNQQVKGAISGAYIWAETICYAICAVLICFWTVEKEHN